MQPLPASFFDRDALDVAYDLVGCVVVCEGVEVRVTEVEAYRFEGAGPTTDAGVRAGDSANHARMGRTARNAPMWGPPGHLYVYLCYGMHPMLNLVTGQAGQAAAVLLRAAEPVRGIERVRSRRTGRTPRPDGPWLLDGPGKLARGLGITVAARGQPLGVSLTVLPRLRTPSLATGPRVGIDYASPEDRAAPWRIADADSAWVSHRRALSRVP